jgi:hypothetical protein
MSTTRYIVDNQSEQTINNEPILRPYKVYTALVTQTGVSVPNDNTGGSLLIGRTYTIAAGSGGWDFTNVGAPNNNVGTSFVATGENPTTWGVDGQLNYDEGAPVVTVLENTIGDIWFTYMQEGEYSINSNNLFNTTLFMQDGFISSDDGWLFGFTQENESQINLLSFSNIGSEDSLFDNTPIEIRLYNTGLPS